MNEILTIMKSELLITAIIFLLLFIKLGNNFKNETLLLFIQIILLLNFLAGFFFNTEGSLFGGMYHTGSLMILQKNILSLGVYLISLLFTDWFKKVNTLLNFLSCCCQHY